MSKTKRNLKFLGIVLIAIALGLLAKDYFFLRNAVQVQATIGSMTVGPEGDEVGVCVYTYVYEGKTYSKRGHVAPELGEEGKHVIAYVNPEDPSEVLVDQLWERWLWIILSGGIGLVLWGMGNQKGPIKSHAATKESD